MMMMNARRDAWNAVTIFKLFILRIVTWSYICLQGTIIIFLLWEFLTGVWVTASLLQFLSILSDLNIAFIWMVSTCPFFPQVFQSLYQFFWGLFQVQQLQLVSPSPSCSIASLGLLFIEWPSKIRGSDKMFMSCPRYSHGMWRNEVFFFFQHIRYWDHSTSLS